MTMRFSSSWKVVVVALLAAAVATPAQSQALNRRADLISPRSGHADPGDVVMEIDVTEALPNALADRKFSGVGGPRAAG
jgi:hypothetical protein